MTHKRIAHTILALGTAAVLSLSAFSVATASTGTVDGTVGPGFSISLKSGGHRVGTLKPNTYRFKVTDNSSIHDFHLIGPGVNKVITSVGFKGTKTIPVKLRKGTYRYQCDPHAGQMHGSFRVG